MIFIIGIKYEIINNRNNKVYYPVKYKKNIIYKNNLL